MTSNLPSKLPPGCYFFQDFLSRDEEVILINFLENLDWKLVQMYGVIAKRQVVHYGLDYTYNSRTISPTQPPPAFMQIFIDRAAELMRIDPKEIQEILVTKYPPGAGIGWHRDAKVFGDKIFGISIAGESILKLRKKTEEKFPIVKVALPPRSAYILSQAARNIWEHSISPVKKLRYSITFRTLKFPE